MTQLKRFEGPWFHGSPEKLEILDKGSWVTSFREFARAFSHKPALISSDDNFKKVKHNGKLPGFLYVVAEDVEDKDLVLLADTDETHWQTQRVLKVELVTDVPILEEELITEQKAEEMKKKHPGTGYWRD